jgi:regulator of protease activity HflC (stomatin/prohibitin superfamily)
MMVLGALSRIGISLEKDVSRIAKRAGFRPVGWPAGAATGSLIYRLPSDPMERASLFAKEQWIRVSEGEIAVVIKDGSLIGAMEPGTYRTEKQRVMGDVDVVWMKTGPQIVRWGVGNVMSKDGIVVGATGTMTVRIRDGARFNAEAVQGALTLPESELQRVLMPGVQGVLRSVLGATEALSLMSERDVFVESVSDGLGGQLDDMGLGLSAFEVAEFNLPAEFKDAMASGTLATARSRGELVEAQVDMQRRVLEAQGDATAMLLTGEARVKVFQQLQAAGIDPMSLEAMDALKKYAESATGGALLGGEAAKAGLIGSIAAAALQADQGVGGEGAGGVPDLPLSLPGAEAAGGAAARAEPGALAAGGDTVESLTVQLDKLTERLADGEISETIYVKLSERLEQRIAALREAQ